MKDVVKVFWGVVAVFTFVMFFVPDQFDSTLQTDIVGTNIFLFRSALALGLVLSMVMLSKFAVVEWKYARFGYIFALLAMLVVSLWEILDAEYANWVWAVPAVFAVVLIAEWYGLFSLLDPKESSD